MKKQDYVNYVEAKAKHSPCFKNCVFAFIIGGAICCLGQALQNLFISLGADKKLASSLMSVSLIFVAGLLTGIGIFDKIARVAGAGTLVPITGFSNAVTSPAIDSKSDERAIIGLSRKAT